VDPHPEPGLEEPVLDARDPPVIFANVSGIAGRQVKDYGDFQEQATVQMRDDALHGLQHVFVFVPLVDAPEAVIRGRFQPDQKDVSVFVQEWLSPSRERIRRTRRRPA